MRIFLDMARSRQDIANELTFRYLASQIDFRCKAVSRKQYRSTTKRTNAVAKVKLVCYRTMGRHFSGSL